MEATETMSPLGESTDLEPAETVHRFKALVARASDGDTGAQHDLKERFRQSPAVRDCYQPARVLALKHFGVLRQIHDGGQSTELAARVHVEELVAELAGEKPSPIERLLAERIALCWLTLHTYELEYECGDSMSSASHAMHQRRITAAQRRYTSALKALADVRRIPVAILAAVKVDVTVGKPAG
jgi:hypothetical protein